MGKSIPKLSISKYELSSNNPYAKRLHLRHQKILQKTKGFLKSLSLPSHFFAIVILFFIFSEIFISKKTNAQTPTPGCTCTRPQSGGTQCVVEISSCPSPYVPYCGEDNDNNCTCRCGTPAPSTPTPLPTPTIGPAPSSPPTAIPTPTPICNRSSTPCQYFSCPPENPNCNRCARYSCSRQSNQCSPCEEHGGICSPRNICYPARCEYGKSSLYCPDGWTCQPKISPGPCSPNNSSNPCVCKEGFILCTFGQTRVPCETDADCERECGGSSFCDQSRGNICNVGSQDTECSAATRGQGSCVDNCSPPNQIVDCPGLTNCNCRNNKVCCGPPPPPQPAGPKIFCDEQGNPVPNPIGAGGQPNRIYTAIGCIPVAGTQEFTEFLLRWGVGIAGGIAILLLIYAGFLIMTSAGNPQKLQAGKELLTAVLMGLALLVFGVYILQLIGVEILRIPEFGG